MVRHMAQSLFSWRARVFDSMVRSSLYEKGCVQKSNGMIVSRLEQRMATVPKNATLSRFLFTPPAKLAGRPASAEHYSTKDATGRSMQISVFFSERPLPFM